MTPPRRLLEGPPGSLERDLLQLWQDDIPPNDAKTNVLGALVGAGYLLPGAPLSPGLGGGPVAPAGAMAAAGKSAATKSLLASVGWAKWFIGGGLLGTVVVSQVPPVSPAAPTFTPTAVVRLAPVQEPARGRPEDPTARDSVPVESAPGQRARGEEMLRAPNGPPSLAPASAPSSRSLPSPRVEPEGLAQREAPMAPTGAESFLPRTQDDPGQPAPSGFAPSGSSLSEQIALLDRARTASESGRHFEALQLLSDYERRFSRGIMEQEALLLRVDVLLKQGQRNAAEAVARRLLDAYPTSSHARRLKSLLSPPDGRDQKSDPAPIRQ